MVTVDNEPAADPAAPDVSAMELFLFELGRALFAVEAALIDEVLPLPRVTPIPGASAVVRGLFNHRGQLLIAVDTAQLLNQAEWSPKSYARVVVSHTGRNATGLLVDTALGIVRMAADRFAPAGDYPRCLGRAEHEGQPLFKLDLQALLRDANRRMAERS